MKKLILLACLLLCLSGCGEIETPIRPEPTKEQIDAGEVNYIIIIQIKQSHFTLDISEHIKDSMNEIEISVPVTPEFYEEIEVGQTLNDNFRIGSFIFHGSFGTWNVKIIDKYIELKTF